jgi:hypothetical protein
MMGNREVARKLREELKRKKTPAKELQDENEELLHEDALKPIDSFRTKAEIAMYGLEFGVELDETKKMAEMYADLEEALKDK